MKESIMALLEVKNVSKKYGARAAMDQVSFDVEAGHIVGLIGPQRCWKVNDNACDYWINELFIRYNFV